jgi:hypothetical protein
MAGDVAGAAEHARAAIEALTAIPPALASALAVAAVAELAAGRAEAALAHAAQGMGILESCGAIDVYEATLRRVHAEALLALGRHDEAAAAIAAAERRLRERAARIGDESWRKSFLERIPDHAATLALATGSRTSPASGRAPGG